NLSWDGWKKSWASVSGISETSKWWRGDLMRFAMEGERYGQRYSQFLDAENYGSLKNLMSVCGKFPPETRHEGLTFTHHVAAAPLMPDHAEVAEEILAQAEKESWSVADVRASVREYLEGPAQDDDDEQPAATGKAKATAPTVAAEPIGIVGVPLEDIEPGTEYYECGITGCESVGFLQAVSHCFDCGAHFDADADECPHCPEMAAGEAQGAAEGPSGAVAGTVITPEDQDIPDDEDTESDAGAPGVSFRAVLAGVPALTAMDAALTAGLLARERDGGLSMTRAIALHEWLGQVVAALPKQSGGKPFSPVPKPAGKKRGRKSNKEKAQAAASEAEE
ncbi:MAG TPA: hypothetical protein VIV12_31145, partial [Streptosporangiaceae bacterium]